MFSHDEIDPTRVTSAREALLCARLNLRGAKRLFRKGSLERGVSALYDSVLFGMQYYISRHDDCVEVDLGDAAGLFHLLMRAGVFEDRQAFNRLSLTVEHALWQGSDSLAVNAMLVEVEQMLAKLGVTTFRKFTGTWKEGDAYRHNV